MGQIYQMNPFPALRTNEDRRQHPYCLECHQICEKNGKDWNKLTSNCKGIYTQEDFQILADRANINLQSDVKPVTLEDVRELYDPSTWIKKNLLFIPHWYQDRVIKCTGIRKMLRQGRRSGKTQIVVADLLRYAVTDAGIKIVCITPMKSQAKEIFDRFGEFFLENREIGRDVRTKQQPYYEINFVNTSRVRIFVAGSGAGTDAAKQIRSQEADILYIDEMDYMSDDSFTAIMPLLSDPERRGEPVRFIGSSTPSGQEGMFFRLCADSYYREFFVPSRFRPDWNEKMEAECRTLAKTQQQYEQEYDAKWGTKADGVFRRNDVVRAQQPYRYHLDEGTYEEKEWPQMVPWPHWIYMIGADWNGGGTGSRIVVVGWDPVRQKWVVVYREVIDVNQFALHVAIDRIVQLNRLWRPHSVYIDAGFGQFQDEYLQKIGLQAAYKKASGQEYFDADILFVDHLKSIDFGGVITYQVKEPETGRIIEKKKRIKNYMVENAQRHFELNDIWFSKSDQSLKQQLIGYASPRKDQHGYLIYKADEEVGDHDLDALILALFAFNQEFDPEFQQDNIDNRIILARRPGQGHSPEEEETKPPDPIVDPGGYQDYLRQHRERRRPAEVDSRIISTPQAVTSILGTSVSYRKTTPRRSGLGQSIGNRNAWRTQVRGRTRGF